MSEGITPVWSQYGRDSPATVCSWEVEHPWFGMVWRDTRGGVGKTRQGQAPLGCDGDVLVTSTPRRASREHAMQEYDQESPSTSRGAVLGLPGVWGEAPRRTDIVLE